MPASQAFAQVDAVFDGGRELFDAREIGAEERFGLFADMTRKTFDAIVFRRPGALTEGIPLECPPATFHAGRLRAKPKRSPMQRRSLQAVLRVRDVPIGKFQLPDAGGDSRLGERRWRIDLKAIGLGRV